MLGALPEKHRRAILLRKLYCLSHKEIAKKMVKLIRSNKEDYSKDKIREFWRENFSAKENYSNFAFELKKIFE